MKVACLAVTKLHHHIFDRLQGLDASLSIFGNLDDLCQQLATTPVDALLLAGRKDEFLELRELSTQCRNSHPNMAQIFLCPVLTSKMTIQALDAGFDDILPLKISTLELQAKLHTQLRRYRAPRATQLRVQDLVFDLESRLANRGGANIYLKPLESKLLEYFMRHSGQVLSRSQILASVWDYSSEPMTNLVTVHMSHLRKKIDHGHEQKILNTVPGFGYRLGP